MASTDGEALRAAAATLGVEPSDDHTTIRRAYRRALLVAHPDHGGSTEQIEAVRRAFELLTQLVPRPAHPTVSASEPRPAHPTVSASESVRHLVGARAGVAEGEGRSLTSVPPKRARQAGRSQMEAAYRQGTLMAQAPVSPVERPAAKADFASLLEREMSRPRVRLRPTG